MAKICFPHCKKGEFVSLADALKFMNRAESMEKLYIPHDCRCFT